MLHYVLSVLGLHCLSITLLWASRLQWDKVVFQPKINDIYLIFPQKCMLWYSLEALQKVSKHVFIKK